MELVALQHEKAEWIGRSFFGNRYRYTWRAYVIDDRESPYGLMMRFNGEDVKVKVGCEGNKRQVEAWICENCPGSTF